MLRVRSKHLLLHGRVRPAGLKALPRFVFGQRWRNHVKFFGGRVARCALPHDGPILNLVAFDAPILRSRQMFEDECLHRLAWVANVLPPGTKIAVFGSPNCCSV
jgi:hypothetical protein